MREFVQYDKNEGIDVGIAIEADADLFFAGGHGGCPSAIDELIDRAVPLYSDPFPAPRPSKSWGIRDAVDAFRDGIENGMIARPPGRKIKPFPAWTRTRLCLGM